MSKRASSTSSSQPQMIAHEKIAALAYEKWCKRGCPQGTGENDWLEAEMELQAEVSKRTTMAAALPAAKPSQPTSKK